MVLETTGLNKLVPWSVPVIAGSLDACEPFFLQAEDLLLEGLLMVFQLFGFLDQTFREGGTVIVAANGESIQTWRELDRVLGMEGVLMQK